MYVWHVVFNALTVMLRCDCNVYVSCVIQFTKATTTVFHNCLLKTETWLGDCDCGWGTLNDGESSYRRHEGDHQNLRLALCLGLQPSRHLHMRKQKYDMYSQQQQQQ